MQPYRRNQILATVGSHARLPQPTSAAEVQELGGLIERDNPAADQHLLGRGSAVDGSYRLTPGGWAAINALGRRALAKKVS